MASIDGKAVAAGREEHTLGTSAVYLKSQELEIEDVKASNSYLLAPIDGILYSHPRFRSLAQRLTGLRTFKKTKEALQQEVDSYIEPDYHTLRQEASAAIGGATWAHRDHENKHLRGYGKVGRKAQKFVTSFAKFLDAYSGVVEVVKKAGGPYGDVAYECLSIFFVIVVNKDNNDQRMAELLERMAKSFPHMDVYMEVYPTRPITTAVVEVYKHIIEFSRTVSRYFMRRRTRYWSAIGRPPALGIDPILASVHGSLAGLSAEAMVLLHKRGYQIQNTVDASHQKLSSMEEKNRILHESLDALVRNVHRLEAINEDMKKAQEQQAQAEAEQKLELIKGLFKIDHPGDEADTAVCGDVFAKAFNNNLTTPRGKSKVFYGSMTMELLEGCRYFANWRDSTTSAILVLSGKTWRESRSSAYTHSWLSKAAMSVVEALRAKDQHATFFSCNPGARADRYLFREVFISTMYQLLKLRPMVMRNKFEQLKAFATEDFGNIKKGADALRPYRTILEDVLREFGDPVTIVLDRVEQCDVLISELMECLVNIVAGDGYCVKIMVVLDPNGGHWNKSGYWDLESCLACVERRESAQGRVQARLDWDQEKRAI